MNQLWKRHLVIAAFLVIAANLGASMAAAAAGEGLVVQVVPAVAAQEGEGFYTANRTPLMPSRLIKLPIGAITPKGWLRHQLELERDGMIGHLPEVSGYCKFEGNAWASPQGQGNCPGKRCPTGSKATATWAMC